MKNIQYSVLMSVYNRERVSWLRESIESMLNQTIKPAEFVLVKDGKLPKDLNEMISKFQRENQSLFAVYELSQNHGLGLALAYGIKKCRYDLVVRMDSDDISEIRRCEKLLAKYQEDTSLDIIGSWESEFEESVDKSCAIHKVPETAKEIYEFMKRRCAILHPTVMYKKQSVLAAGNYHDVRMYEDYDLFLRMVMQCHMKAYNLQEVLYHIRVNDEFYKRRGGIKYMRTAVDFKYKQYKMGYFTVKDFVISAGGQALVCLLPNALRKLFYMKVLRR